MMGYNQASFPAYHHPVLRNWCKEINHDMRMTTLGVAAFLSLFTATPSFAGQSDGLVLATTKNSLCLMEIGSKTQFPLGMSATAFESSFGPAERRDEEPAEDVMGQPNPDAGGATLCYFTEGLMVHVSKQGKVNGFEVFLRQYTSSSDDVYSGTRLVLRNGKTELPMSATEHVSVRKLFKFFGVSPTGSVQFPDNLTSHDFRVNTKQVTVNFERGSASSVAVFN